MSAIAVAPRQIATASCTSTTPRSQPGDRPLTRSADLRWAAAHCRKLGSYGAYVERTTFTDFSCVPADAKRPVRRAPVAAPFASSVNAPRGSR